MRCKRPARFLEDHAPASRRDDLSTRGLEEQEEVVPFTDVIEVPAVKSAIARVTRTPAGRFRIFGVAWTDGAALASVEVKVDEGAWQRASLDDRGSPHAGTFFTLEIDALPAGEHRLVSRATDATGRTETETLETKQIDWEDNARFRRTIAVA
jgi:hypothetical protein